MYLTTVSLFFIELIDTWWDVNSDTTKTHEIFTVELIDT